VSDGVWLSDARGVLTRQGLVVYLNWQVLTPPGADVETVLELHDNAGQLVAIHQGFALGGYSPPRLWQPGDLIEDSMRFATPPPGSYTIWAGLQQAGGGQRLPVTGAVTDSGLVKVGQVVVP
jgi:hypothetical protein